MVKNQLPPLVTSIKSHKLQEINYAYQKSISYSQMSMFNKCPKQWQLQYRDGHMENTSNVHTVFGTAMHETLQNWCDVAFNQSVTAANKINLLDYFWEAFFKDAKKNLTKALPKEEFLAVENDVPAILDYFTKNNGWIFSRGNKKGGKWTLVDIELPVVLSPNFNYSNVVYKGYLDLVFYHERSNQIKIIDIKTSTKGWNKWQKKDDSKQAQLLLYKKFFMEQFNIPMNNIEVEFIIFSRQAKENPYSGAKTHVETFSSFAQGKNKINKAWKELNNFIIECFETNGKYKDKEYEAKPDKWGCTFCPFKDNKLLCEVGVSS